MDYVNLISLTDLNIQKSRSFVCPLATACGQFKLVIKKKGLSLVVYVELVPPTLNGSEQFPWVLHNVGISLRIVHVQGYNREGSWTFTSISRTWACEYISYCDLAKLSRTPPPRASFQPVPLSRQRNTKPSTTGYYYQSAASIPAIEIKLTIPSPRFMMFSVPTNALIHTSSYYRNIHRAFHVHLHNEITAMVQKFMQTNAASVFHQLRSYLVHYYPHTISMSVTDVVELLVGLITPQPSHIFKAVDWEGDSSALSSIIHSCRTRESVSVVLLRLNAESGYLKMMMKWTSIDIPAAVATMSGMDWQCVAGTFNMGRHEVSLFAAQKGWLRILDNGVETTTPGSRFVCHRKFVPTTLLYIHKPDLTAYNSYYEYSLFKSQNCLATGISPAGGLALVSPWTVPSISTCYDVGSTTKCPEAIYSVIPYELQEKDDFKVLRDVYTILDEERSADETKHHSCGSSSTSASSELSKQDRKVHWMALANLFWKRVGYTGLIWADALFNLPVIQSWPISVSARLFGSNTLSQNSVFGSKRGAGTKNRCCAQHRLVSGGKRRRLPSHDGYVDDKASDISISPVSLPDESGFEVRESGNTQLKKRHTTGTLAALRRSLNSMFNSRFNSKQSWRDHQEKPKTAPETFAEEKTDKFTAFPDLIYIRLILEFDPMNAYGLTMPANTTTSTFKEALQSMLVDFYTRYRVTGWLQGLNMNGIVTLWKRHGTTWRQIVARNSRSLSEEFAGGGLNEAPEILVLLHPDKSQNVPSITETLLDVYCLNRLTYEPVHVGLVPSMSNMTIQELYKSMIRSRVGVIRPSFCSTSDGQPVLEQWSIKKLRLTQGALFFSAHHSISSRSTARRSARRRGTTMTVRSDPAAKSTDETVMPVTDVTIACATKQAPSRIKAIPKKGSVKSNGAMTGAEEYSRRQLDHLWQEFISGSLSTGDEIQKLSELLTLNKSRAVKYIDQLKTVDTKTCELMVLCGERLVPNMLNAKSSSKRSSQPQTVALSFAAKLQACLLRAASQADRRLCDSCLTVLRIIEQDEQTQSVFHQSKL